MGYSMRVRHEALKKNIGLTWDETCRMAHGTDDALQEGGVPAFFDLDITPAAIIAVTKI